MIYHDDLECRFGIQSLIDCELNYANSQVVNQLQTMRCYGHLMKERNRPLTARQNKAGFMLVELSIVLVIIALIVGGIVVGKELIHVAKIRATISEFDDYKTKLTLFKMKYNYWPGDFPRAAQFFGAPAISGNGDGRIQGWETREWLRAWQHMYAAGLIDLPLNATLEPDYPRVRGGINVPPSRYSKKVHYWLAWEITDNQYQRNIDNGNYLQLAMTQTTYPMESLGLAPSDAQRIDSKMDDGFPMTGLLRPSYYTNCFNFTTMRYRNGNLAYCRLYYRLD